MPTLRDLIQLSRVDKPGTMLIFWPYAWSLTAAARQFHAPLETYLNKLVFGFFVSASLHGSIGCIWDDIVDKDLDAQVERTKKRVLPSGRVSIPEALVFLGVNLLIYFVLIQPMSNLGWWVAVLAVGPMSGLYPFMKRITNLPQVWLGFTLSVPVLLGPIVLVNKVTSPTAVMAAGNTLWAIWYDAIYACQDKKDDEKAGVKSIVFATQRSFKLLLIILATGTASSWFLAGWMLEGSLLYYTISAIGGSLVLASRTFGTNLEDPKDCGRTFLFNILVVGPVVYAGFLFDYLSQLA